MTNTTETIVFNSTKEAAEAIQNMIDTQPGSQSYLTERKNLDGDIPAWIVIANLAVQALPHVLGFIKGYLEMKQAQVSSIKMGDLEIKNPTPEDIERFRILIDSRSK